LRAYKIDENIIKIIHSGDLDFASLNSCYRFLALLIWNNLQNKLEITFDMKLAYQHMMTVSYCVDFVREMFHNNKVLLYNEKQVTQVVKSVCKSLKSLPKDSYQRAKLMDLLRVL
jgi:inositol 1,4,5-triphosphate receptor type 1/inositol 1,4,5-triphosphate receptor type 3